MADDKLRIVATVEDQFTGPLGKLQKGLAGVGEETKKHGAVWKKDWAEARGEVTKFQGVLSGFSPILATVGMGSFGAAASITGLGAAIRSFSGNTQALAMMSKETGLSIDKLRAFGELGERFGVSADAMKGSIVTLSESLWNLRRHGDLYTGLQAKNLAGLAEDLAKAPTTEAALKRLLKALQTSEIPDPQIKKMIARMLMGTDDPARIAMIIGEDINKALDDTAKKMGRTSDEQVAASQRFERSMSDLRANMEGLKTGALTPLIEEFNHLVTFLNKPESVSFFKRELAGIGQGLKDTKEEALKLFELWESYKGVFSDDPHEPPAFAKPSGPAASKAAPSEAEVRRDQLEGRKSSVERQLQLLERNPNAPGYQLKHDRMVEELKRVGDELQKLREGGGASVSQSSFGGGGSLGGGSLIQKAAWGGGGIGGAGPLGGPGGGGGGASGRSGGGAGGGSGGAGGTAGTGSGGGRDAPDIGGGMRGRPFGSKGPLAKGAGGGGQYTSAPPGAAGTYRPQRQLTERDLDSEVINTIAGEARLKSSGGTDAVINNMFNRLGTTGWGPSRDLHDVARARKQYEGYRRATPEQAAYIRDRIRAIASGGVPDNTRGSNSFRANWYRGPWYQRHGRFGQDIGGNIFAYDPSIPNGPYAPYAEPKTAAVPPKATGADDKSPLGDKSGPLTPPANDPDFFPNGTPRVMKPKSMANDPRVPGVVMDHGSPVAGPGFRQVSPWQKAPATGGKAGAPDKAELDAYRADREKRARSGEVPGEEEDDAAGFAKWKAERSGAKPNRAGDALMDRFYGKGAAGGGPAMQMPGGAGGPAGKGRLDIHLHGFPEGARVKPSTDGLFHETNVSRGRPQMDMDRA